jgi:hypothetical protein
MRAGRTRWIAVGLAIIVFGVAGCSSSSSPQTAPTRTTVAQPPSSTSGSGASHTSLANFCRDLNQLKGVKGTDPATLQHAADLFRKLAGEVPDATIKSDLTLLADSEIKVKNGEAASVSKAATDSANSRFATYAGQKCQGQ